jgi:hypothetical protein
LKTPPTIVEDDHGQPHVEQRHRWQPAAQCKLPEQVPQLCATPQLSLADPQLYPNVVHGSGSLGVHPHLYAVPPPPHVCGAVHGPQLNVPPHPSGGLPHVAPTAAQVVVVQPHTLGTPPPPHVFGAVQPGQVCVTPQLSVSVPHDTVQSTGGDGVQPHTFGTPPPPHVCGAVHVDPQSRDPPHESVITPHLPVQLHVGVHPHTFDTPPPPHVSGAVHAPQSCVPPQPSGIDPHLPVQSNVGVHPHTPDTPPPPHVW